MKSIRETFLPDEDWAMASKKRIEKDFILPKRSRKRGGAVLPIEVLWYCRMCQCTMKQSLPNDPPKHCYSCGSPATKESREIDPRNILA